MERIVNKESIENVLIEHKKGLHVRDIAKRLFYEFPQDVINENDALEFEKSVKDVNRILNNDVKRKSGEIFAKVKKGVYRLKGIKKEPLPDLVNPASPNLPDIEKSDHTNLFTGKAGECVVMSELLFRGYNVNSMLVDDGVDIVASKNNMFYYLQVKTTYLSDKNRVYATIKQSRFNDFIGTHIRYVIVARCKLNKAEANICFVFNNSDIQRFISQGKIKSTDNGVYIKIEFDPKDNKPYIYADKREDIEFFKNKFEL
jgi:hypothetical protein